MENIPSSLKMLAYKFSSRKREISTCTVRQDICPNTSHLTGLCPIHNCKQCCNIRLHEPYSGLEAETLLNTAQDEAQELVPQHTCRFSCALHCDSSKATKLNSNTSRARGILNDKETYKQRSRRKTKGQHQILPEANNLLDITTDQREEKSAICQFSDQTTYYSCLPVDEVSSEPLCKTVENKVKITYTVPQLYMAFFCGTQLELIERG